MRVSANVKLSSMVKCVIEEFNNIFKCTGNVEYISSHCCWKFPLDACSIFLTDGVSSVSGSSNISSISTATPTMKFFFRAIALSVTLLNINGNESGFVTMLLCYIINPRKFRTGCMSIFYEKFLVGFMVIAQSNLVGQLGFRSALLYRPWTWLFVISLVELLSFLLL